MAAGLGFKDFVTGEVLTANDVDGYLMQNIWVFADAAARTAAVTSPQEGNYSYLKDTNSTEYYTGSAWVAVGGGGGGKVLQVVQGTTTTATTIASTSFTDTSLTATITPSSATSKILVISTQQVFYTRNAAGIGISAKLLRGATVVYSAGNNGYETNFIQGPAGTYYVRGVYSLNYLDSPATTSATTYKIQAAVNDTSSGGTSTFQEGSTQSNIILLEIGA